MAKLPRCRCGGEAKVYHMPTRESDSYFIACPTCERATGWFSKESDAKKCWLSMHPVISQADVERLLDIGQTLLQAIGSLDPCSVAGSWDCKTWDCDACPLIQGEELVARLTKVRETTNEREGG